MIRTAAFFVLSTLALTSAASAQSPPARFPGTLRPRPAC